MSGHDPLAVLDDLLFRESGWFLIDAQNHRVKGLAVPSRAAGLALLDSHPTATAVVGSLREGVWAVDVDLADWRAEAVCRELATWCAERDLWTLHRPSGGQGRWHVFVAPETHGVELESLVADLRTRLRASAKAIDLRKPGRGGALRPLTSPHRTTGALTMPVWGGRSPATVITDLTARLDAPPLAPRQKGVSTGNTTRTVSTGNTPLVDARVPRPRPHRPLPRAWADWLTGGPLPPLGGSDHSRSTYEAVCTGHMLRAGWTAAEAWDAILTAHGTAMASARERGRAKWVRYVWNKAAADDATQPPSREVPTAVLAAAHAARTALWAYHPGQRGRTSVLRVGLAILDRITRTGHLTVPASERDLALDTALDRKTIRHALHTLEAHHWGTLHRTPSLPGTEDGIPHAYSFEIPPAPQGVALIPPSSFYNPPAPTTLWHTLPALAAIAWHHLAHHGPSTARQLLTATGTHPTSTPTALRTLQHALTALAHAGAVVVAPDGRWQTTGPEPVDEAAARHHATAAAAWEERHARITSERRHHRAATWSDWSHHRARAHQQQVVKTRTWRASFTPEAWEARHHRQRTAFRRLPLREQARLKQQWANQRRQAGIDEAIRHQQWYDGIPDEDYAERSALWRTYYDSLTREERRERVEALEAHRDRFGIRRLPMKNPHQPALVAAA